MKKTLLNIAVGLFILSATSCTDEVLINETNGLRISGGMAPDSRTTFVQDGDWTHTHWEINDAIGLYTTDQTNVSYQAVSSGSYSEFIASTNTTLNSVEGNKVRAYYPYTSKASGNSVPLPYTISQSSDSPAAAFLYSEATISNNSLNFSFKHVFSYLKITLSAQQFKDNLPNGCTLKDGGLYIQSENPISAYDASFNMINQQITHHKTDNERLFYYTDNLDYNGNDTYTYMIPILPQPGNTSVNVSLFYPQTGNTGYVSLISVYKKNTPSEGFLAGNVYELDITGGEAGSISEKQALTDLYQSTNGSQWLNNTNWLSNLPVSEWYGINNSSIKDFVYTVELSYNNLNGTIPESLAALMNRAAWLDISQNAIHGTIPDAVKSHYKWSKLGWLIVPQDPRKGGGLDLENSNLYMPSSNTTNLIDGTTNTLSNIFSKNKLTQVICLNKPSQVNDVINQFPATRVNQHLDYQSKGLGTVIFTDHDPGTSQSNLVNGLKDKYGTIEGLDWLYELPNATIYYNMTYVFDSNGQLVHIAPYSSSLDNFVVEKNYTAFLSSVFGDPVKHDKFSFDFYTSTDYSKDGEVFTMQSATEGKGIDLVFLGEGFVDKDMAAGGRYETKMKEAADKLFELEPYKSFRNRFNLYGVKVVSPTAEFTSGAEKRINENYETAFSYAEKYDPNLPQDARMMIIVVYNTDSYVGRSYCAMFGNGDFVAFNMDVIDNTLIHEVGGHGFAKLGDEYVEGGYEFVTIPQDEMNTLDTYHSHEWGWFSNVDYHNSKSTIRWSRLLNDSRYAYDGLGIYEGAYTYGKGVYRPSDNSMMRYNISWFNAPSREAIYKAIMTLSEGAGWTYKYEDFVAYDAKNRSTSAATSRSAAMKQSRKEMLEIREKHREPVFIQGSLRDAARKSKKNNITVPLR